MYSSKKFVTYEKNNHNKKKVCSKNYLRKSNGF